MDLGLSGRVCVVTGASRGIGRATAERLAAEGARVLLVGRDRDALHDAAAACEGRGHVLVQDVTAPGAAAQVADAAQGLGTPWALVNNAGTSFARGMDELTDADWHALYDLHVVAPMRLMKALAPSMARTGGGRVVNVCSSAGKRPSATNPAYSVTKAAQLSLSRLFADLHAGEGVLVNAVTPGPVASELWMADGGLADQTAAARGISRDEALAVQAGKVPLGRFAEPGEVADVIVFLCSTRASTVTGAAWSADGGAVAIII
jgi:3-oxoacyl-[acyl-carrier protein] reductase